MAAPSRQIPSDVRQAVSYYQLYTIQAPTRQAPTVQIEVADDFVDAERIWQDDADWTDADTARAKAILAEGRARCRVKDPHRISNDDQESWNRFYATHQTNFFKDRHYLAHAFPNEFGPSSEPRTLVEIGCGVGNAFLPLLEENWTVHGLDLSRTAIDLLQQEQRFQAAGDRAQAYCCDISQELPSPCRDIAHVTTLLFCLSAIDPARHRAAAENVVASLRQGGVLVIRDYGRYDEAQLKLGSQRDKMLDENFYRKHDGTKCFYFSLEDLQRLFVDELGLEVLELRYFRRTCQNRATQSIRRRVWVQARFRKPEN